MEDEKVSQASEWTTATTKPLPRDENGIPKTQFTSAEVIEMGIKSEKPIPEPKKCKYCGKTLYYRAIVLWGMLMAWSPQPERCTCERAKAYWERKDRENAAKKESERLEAERKTKVEQIEKLFSDSGIKKRFANRTFANYKTETDMQKRAYNSAKKYADNFKKAAEAGDGLYIVGGNGTGKTHLAAAIALQLIGQGVPVIFKTSPDLFADVKKAFGERDGITEYDITRAYKTVDLLIIDDLGKERCSEWSMTTLYEIINDRYEDCKPTIIVTNYAPDDLATALTPEGGDRTKIDAIISRLRETTTLLSMYGDDNRWRK